MVVRDRCWEDGMDGRDGREGMEPTNSAADEGCLAVFCLLAALALSLARGVGWVKGVLRAYEGEVLGGKVCVGLAGVLVVRSRHCGVVGVCGGDAGGGVRRVGRVGRVRRGSNGSVGRGGRNGRKCWRRWW